MGNRPIIQWGHHKNLSDPQQFPESAAAYWINA